MAKVFVSYSRKDIEFAKRLTAELQKSDLDFWIDWEGIPPTVDWWREIEKGIEESDVFIFLISPDSAKSKICGQEIDTAVKNGKRLIPLVVRDIKGDETPSQLSHLNWIFFREGDDFDAGLQKLVTGIHTDYEWVKEHRWLQVRALDWERENKDSGSLLRGKDLQDAEFQLATNTSKEPHPTDLQREYVFTSRTAADRQRRVTMGFSIAGIIALATLAIWGWGQAGQATLNADEANKNAAIANAASTLAFENAIRADHEAAIAQAASTFAVSKEQEAERQAQISLARQWAAEANFLLANQNGNTETAALLSLRALQLHDVYLPSADAALVASLNKLYTVKIFDEHESKVSAVAYSPNGDRISIGYGDGTVGLYDLPVGKEIRHFNVELRDYEGDPYETGIHALSFSADGNSLLIADSGGRVVVWNLVTFTIEVDFYVQENLPLWSAKFSPNGQFILISTGFPHSGPGNIYLYNLQNGEKANISFAQLQQRYVTDVEFSSDGSQVLSTSWDKSAILWDINWESLEATPIQTFELSSPIRDGAISANGELILLGTDNNSAELYTSGGVLKQTYVGHTSYVYSVNFSPDGRHILTGSWDKTARLWDIESAKVSRILANHMDSVSSSAFSPDGKHIITGSYDRTARLWNADPLHDARTIYGHVDPINSVSYSPDGTNILSASRDNSVRVWNAATLELEDTVKQSEALLDPRAVFSAGGRWLAAGSEDYQGPNANIAFWEKIGGEYPKPVVVPTNDNHVSSLVFSPPGDGGESEYLLTGYENGQLDLWQNVDGVWNTVRTVVEPYGGPSFPTVMFTSDSKYIASVNGKIKIINIQDPNEVVSSCAEELFSGTTYNAKTIAFSPDSKYLAVPLGNDVVILNWKTNQRQGCTLVGRLNGHLAPVKGLIFSPDGNYLMSTSEDGIAILWGTETWQQLRLLAGHEGVITSAAFSPDSKSIVTGGADKTIRIWDVDYMDAVRQVCSILLNLGRDFTEPERSKYGITDEKPTCNQ
ncbi:MAG TPA: TIR domain-containing protein, partial [Anaerolineales bacterium]|nr:TIR domain-containing protein [Anaerolineales bacterium]